MVAIHIQIHNRQKFQQVVSQELRLQLRILKPQATRIYPLLDVW